jgi:chemotaxis protein methyltransferase CheR
VTESDDAVERFRLALARRLGLAFEESRLASLSELLRVRAAAAPGGLDAYLRALEGSSPPKPELRALAQILSVPETYFFRNADSFRAFTGAALPARIAAAGSTRTLALLSAGCASGEEPYSLAMALRDRVDAGWRVTIRAIDMNPAMLERAARGRYTSWALRETPPELRRRWFRRDASEYVLDARVREMVAFEERNLTEEDESVWRPGSYDVVFCRNVIMYFTPEAARAVIARIARALMPGGFLFLGHAETLRGVSQDFHLRHTHDTFFYEKRDGSEPVAGDEASAHAPRELPAPAPELRLDDPSWGTSWVDTVRRSSERIAQLASTSATDAPTPSADARGSATDVARAVALMREERFAEATALVDSLSEQAARDPDVLLLRAILSTHGGDLEKAEALCQELLAMDEMSAGAHYLMALCLESAGDVTSAAREDRLAAHLDPAFAMPRLHLGLMARRAGDLELARGELESAVALLEREDPSRVLLFGGGFGRDALVAVCRAQLAACGGRS